MKTLAEINAAIKEVEETLSSYKDVDYEWGSYTHRHIDDLERRLEELYYAQRDLQQKQ